MDAIALLCTLHADGPATARRLRRSGCSTLAALLALEPERLATILEGPPAVARRFLREAKSLSERLGGAWNEREEESAPLLPATEGGTIPDAAPTDVQLQGREQRILDEVLASWRRKDADETAATNGRNGASTTRAGGGTNGADSIHAKSGSNGKPMPALPSRAPAVSAEVGHDALATDRLCSGAVDGLDVDACTRLASAGVSSLEDLVRIDAVAVASATGLGFTRLTRWRALAERARRASHDTDGAATSDRSQPADPPAAERPTSSAPRRPVLRFSPQETPQGPATAVDLLVPIRASGTSDARADFEDPAGPFA